MGVLDRYKWKYNLSRSNVLVLALSKAQYNQYQKGKLKFTDQINRLESYTGEVALYKGERGYWRPHYYDKWYIIYINSGNYDANIIIHSKLEPFYFLIFYLPLLIGGVIGIISIIFLIKKLPGEKREKKKKDKEEVSPIPASMPQDIPADTLKLKINYCIKCGSSISDVFCTECGTKRIEI